MLNADFIAGYFEGEGCIRYHKSPHSKTHAWLVLMMGSTNKWILEEINTYYRGNGKLRICHRKTERTAESWNLEFSSKYAIEIAREFVARMDSCCEKKAQLEYAISVGKKGTLSNMRTLSAMKTHDHRREFVAKKQSVQLHLFAKEA